MVSKQLDIIVNFRQHGRMTVLCVLYFCMLLLVAG